MLFGSVTVLSFLTILPIEIGSHIKLGWGWATHQTPRFKELTNDISLYCRFSSSNASSSSAHAFRASVVLGLGSRVHHGLRDEFKDSPIDRQPGGGVFHCARRPFL